MLNILTLFFFFLQIRGEFVEQSETDDTQGKIFHQGHEHLYVRVRVG